MASDQDRRNAARDAAFAEAVAAIASDDLRMWQQERDVWALARCCSAAEVHASMLAAAGPGDEHPKVWQLSVLKAQAHAARCARLLAHEQVTRLDSLVAVLEAEAEAETGAVA